MNLYELAELCGVVPSDDLYLEIVTQTEFTITARFANTKDATCIYTKIGELEMIIGGIIMWHGLLADIPDTYALCDGTNGTPDLREKFIRGSANGVDPGGGGGNVNHTHTFLGDGHQHGVPAGSGQQLGTDRAIITTSNPATGTTDAEDGRPPFYDIAYIMKL